MSADGSETALSQKNANESAVQCTVSTREGMGKHEHLHSVWLSTGEVAFLLIMQMTLISIQ